MIDKRINSTIEKYCFIHIEIEKLSIELFKILTDYIYCHNIMVLQIYRQAFIASYVDIKIENELSLKYIEDIDDKREKLTKMIKLHIKYIKHLKFDYEDLIGIYSQSFWDALIAWIGHHISLDESVIQNIKVNLDQSCLNDDINNEIVSNRLHDTVPFYFCKKYRWTQI